MDRAEHAQGRTPPHTQYLTFRLHEYPVPTDDGNIANDPPGFERKAFLARLGREIPAFFDKALPIARS